MMKDDGYYVSLTGDSEEQVRTRLKNKWKTITLEEVLDDLNDKDIKKSDFGKEAVEFVINAYRTQAEEHSESIKIR